MKRAHYTVEASNDIDDISEHIGADNLDAAIGFCLAVEDAAQKLAEMPGMGPIRKFSGVHQEIRSWPLKGFRKYLVFYSPAPSGITIIRILHGARDIDSIFSQL